MALPTLVNGQITDSITQAGLGVLGNAPAMAMGAIYQSLAHSTSLLYQNSVAAQKMAAISAQAATNQGVIQIYSFNTMAAAAATTKLARSDSPNWLLTLLVVLAAVKGK